METISIRDYLTRKGTAFRESGKELIAHCLFSSCDNDSVGNEAHLYFSAETSQYDCKKCGAKGNIFTLAKHFGDDIQSIMLDSQMKIVNMRHPVMNGDAMRIWENATEPPADFPYLKKKGVRAHGARFWNDCLILPLYAPNGTLSSLQFIDMDGNKKFLHGGRTAECLWLIGTPIDKVCIAEGFATAASIIEATDYATVVAFSAGNLKTTAKEIKNRYPGTEVIICGDTDSTGSKKAEEAAMATGTLLAFPIFEYGAEIDGKPPSDFNDLYILQGVFAVKSSILIAERICGKYDFTPLDTLLNEPEEEVSWIIDDLLPSSGFSIIVAKPKVGKSTVARQMGLSVARGEAFLGRQTTKGTVLYVSLEEKRSEVRNHFRLMGATGAENLGVYTGSTPEDAYEWLKREVERQKPVLIIIDTLFRFARVTDVNDYAKIITVLDPLLSIAREKSVHLMVIHHARKSAGDGADATLGSTAIFGTVDTAILLKRMDGKRTIETQQRYGTDMEPTILIFDTTTRMVALGGTKEENDTQKVADAILELLKAEEMPITEAAIDEQIDGRTVFKRKALRELVANGGITRIGSGKRGDPFLYSCSLVPAIYTEQDKQESENDEKGDTLGILSRSQDFKDSHNFGNKKMNLSREHDASTGLF